jgi:hypothetical protein
MHVQKSSSCGCKCRMEVGVKVGLPMRFFFFFFIFMFSFFPSCQQCLQLACLPLYITVMEINKNITIISILKDCTLFRHCGNHGLFLQHPWKRSTVKLIEI